MIIISKEQWADTNVEIFPHDTGKLDELCRAINETLILHKRAELLIDEEISIPIADEWWPTLEEYEKLRYMVEEAGFEYLAIIKNTGDDLMLRVGVNSRYIGDRLKSCNSAYKVIREHCIINPDEDPEDDIAF